MHREKASAAFCCTDRAEVVEEGLLFVVVVEPSWATGLPDEPPHADTSSDTPTSPASAEARSSARESRRLRGADRLRKRSTLRVVGSANRFTLSMIVPPDNSRRSQR
jgi:hypothetical protein